MRTLSLLVLLTACKSDTTPPVIEPTPAPPLPASCDAGDEAWVQRVMPVMWGRRAQGAAEVQVWASMANQFGREAVIDGMATSPEFTDWWTLWLTDELAVARVGDKAFAECYRDAALDTHDGSLTQFIRSTNSPWDTSFEGGTFTMRDVLADAIVADDLAVAWQAHLFARMGRPVQGANVSLEELEYNRRVNFGEGFYETYLNRNLDCVLCHNSTFSTTDAPDARFDRTWQLPGKHETALLGSTVTYDKDALFAMFRHDAVTPSNGGGRRPWGMAQSCGQLRGPAAVGGSDLLGQETSYFVEEFGLQGSVWDVERLLRQGANALSTNGLTLGEDNAVDGAESFAYLVGARITDRVFEATTGGRLTISHGFPRNLHQASRLEGYTDAFVTSGFSLRTLLKVITADELFNPSVPSECETQTYGLDPVVNPWSVEDQDPQLRNNSPGDLVHRLPARVLLRSAHAHLGRSSPAQWGLQENERDFQATLGVFLRESQPGFNGTDFQGLLAFQSRFATCGNVGATDWIADLRERTSEATTEEQLMALKDHLFADGQLDEEERSLLAALVGPLEDRAGDVTERRLRLVCGAMLNSAAYMLTVHPTTSPPPALARQPLDVCVDITARMVAAGYAPTTCD